MEISKAKIKLFASLSAKKHRKQYGLFVAEGTKCVLDTIDYFQLEALIALPEWYEQNPLSGLPADVRYEATHKQMQQLSSLSTAPEVVAVYHIPNWNIDEVAFENDLTIVLDGVQDPGNLGTIMRIADWFGIGQIVASPDTVDVFNPKSIQATMGAVSRVKIFYTEIPAFLAQYPMLPVYVTSLDGEDIYMAELSDKGFIVMGNEGKGVTTDVMNCANRSLFIPSYPADRATSESLNVGVATAITVAEFRRRVK